MLVAAPGAAAAGVVRLYQVLLSPLKRALFGANCGCRFHPTCSCYAHEAFRRHGLLAGMCLAAGRVLRCHPWNSGGYDPVPDEPSAGVARRGSPTDHG